MKTIFTSRTIWFGIAQIVFGAVGYLSGWIDQGNAITLVTTGVATLKLRLITSKPIEG